MKKIIISILTLLFLQSCDTNDNLLTNENEQEKKQSEKENYSNRAMNSFSPFSDFTYAQGWRVAFKVTEKTLVDTECKMVTKGHPPYEYEILECEDIYEKRTMYKGHPRRVADVNGDGKDDIVGFGQHDVWVSLSNGSNFEQTKSWSKDFCDNYGWRVDIYDRTVADVNGDGKADIVGFGHEDVWVSLSNGNGFEKAQSWSKDFSFKYGWNNYKNVRTVADVNGDGKADIVGFGDHDVWVSLSNGNSFEKAQSWIKDFSYNIGGGGGWRTDKHVRTLADVNGDGKADIVGFGYHDVWVSLSNGSSFSPTKSWIKDFSYYIGGGGWRTEKHVRTVADVNGDGKADIVGFGEHDVWVSFSDGNNFGRTYSWVKDYSFYNGGWRVDSHVRTTGDLNGDGKADIVGFGGSQVLPKLSEY